MRVLVLVVAVLVACGFEGANGSGDPPVNELPGCASSLLDLCDRTATAETLMVSGTRTIDTGVDTECTEIINQAGGPQICLKYVTRVEIAAGAVLRANGPRSLALAASTEIVVRGVIDVSSRRDPRAQGPGSRMCPFASDPENDGGGGGGGAGGTYATAGGAGGEGDSNDGNTMGGSASGGGPGQQVVFSLLQGGCAGQKGGNNNPSSGAGGLGGGAIYVAAPRIEVGAAGSIRATGAAGSGGGQEGQGGGGGGGGSGGAIVLRGETIEVAGLLLATGAGGGQGGTGPTTGEQGEEPSSTAPASGGDQQENGGRGGNGATVAGGMPGEGDEDGAGGGGGGGGFIRILSATPTLEMNNIAPTPEIAPR